MNKIIVAFDGLEYSKSTEQYSIEIAKETKSHLVAVFLEDFTYHTYTYNEVVSFAGAFENRVRHLDVVDKQKRDEAVLRFEKACSDAAISFSIHRDKDIAYRVLLHETIYADLLIIGKREKFNHYDRSEPSGFLTDIMAEAQCPVLLVPGLYRPVSKLVFLYDGKPSSVYAIKMFTYTMPLYAKLPVEVLTIKEDKENMHLPDGKLMKEFMKRHFPQAKYRVVSGDPANEATKFIKMEEMPVMIVLGAYARSAVSRWFSTSLADYLLPEVNAPLFIAHNK